MSELARPNTSFSLSPRTLDEAMGFAKMIAESAFCPKDFFRKPGDVLCAMQFAAEIGLSPMQGLQNIAVINGKPSLYGDAALAVCKSHPSFVSIDERDASKAAAEGGLCTVTVRNADGTQSKVSRAFTPDDAKRANLIGKSGPWSQYPGRMYQMRARAFALRDALPEALKGIAIREEAEDYPPTVPNTTALSVAEAVAESAGVVEMAPSPIDDFILRIEKCESVEALGVIANEIGEVGLSKDARLVAAWKARKAAIEGGART